MAAYLSVSDYLPRADIASVARLCSRTGTPLGGSTSAGTINVAAATAALASDPVLAAALLDASAEVLKSAKIGDLYTNSDLAGMQGLEQAALWRLVARLTACLLWEDRMREGDTGTIEKPIFYELVYDALGKLEQGMKLF